MGAAGTFIKAATVEGIILSSTEKAIIYAVAGAAAGATNAAITGANIGEGALYGAGFSLAGALFGIPKIDFFDQSGSGFWSGVAGTTNRLLNSSLIGAAYGAAYAGMTGGDPLKGAAMGALGWAAGSAVNMLIGHAVGLIGSGFSTPKGQDGAWIYEGANVSNMSAITFGNVILSGKGFAEYANAPYDSWQSRLYRHEMGHVSQYLALGPSFLPAYGGQFPAALIVFQNPFEFNLLENFFLGGAPTTYEIY